MAHDDMLMSMRGNNLHFNRATVHHELIPGHHLQGFMSNRFNDHRSLFGTPFWGEGWALYWELVLWDQQFPRGPEDRIGMLFWRMHRAARIIFSLSFHLEQMTPQEAVDFLVHRVGHERANADAEVRRSFAGSYSPLYQVAWGSNDTYRRRTLTAPLANRRGRMTGEESEPSARARLRYGAPDAAAPIGRQTVTGQVVEALRDQILSGAYAEDEPLRQDAVAAELGVSRIPVREALRQLEAEGLVAFNPHCGAVVSSLSLSEIEELFELRGLIESELVLYAVPRLTAQDLDRADAILDAYDAAFERRDVAEWGALNWQFHSTLLAAANRPLTLGMLHKLHNQSDRYTRMQLALTHGEIRATGEHRQIAEAARAGDGETASALLRAHVVNAGASLTEFLRVHRAESPPLRAVGGS